jgi:hypothetical protein
MNQPTRTTLAFLVAPIIPIVLFSGFYFGRGRFLPLLPFVTAVAYFITIVVAMPIYMVMVKRGWLRWWHFGLVGAIPALSFDAFLYLMSLGSGGGSNFSHDKAVDLIVDRHNDFVIYLHETRRLLLMALTGVASGFVFWCIAYAASNQALKTDARKAARLS